MSKTYAITDHTTGTTTTADRYAIAETLKSLNPEAPAEVLQACEDLEAKLHRGEYIGEEEAFLNVSVDLAE